MTEPWIITLNHMAASWADAMWRATWQGSVFAAVVWLGCLAFKRATPSLRCWLWWFVCLKTLTAISSAAFNLPIFAPNAAPIVPKGAIPIISPLAAPTPLVALPPEKLNLQVLVFAVWILGVALTSFSILRSVYRLRKTVRAAQLLDDRTLVRERNALSKSLGLTHEPQLLKSSGGDVFTFGGTRPVIVFPQRILTSCSADELRMVLAHEMAHVRRCDVWFAFVPQIVRLVFFFNPVAWLVTREYSLARECECDRIALDTLAIRPERYGRLLLKLGDPESYTQTLSSPGASSHFRILKRRIVMLNKFKPLTHRRVPSTLGAALSLLAAGSLVPLTFGQTQPGAIAPAAQTDSKISQTSAAAAASATRVTSKVPVDPTTVATRLNTKNYSPSSTSRIALSRVKPTAASAKATKPVSGASGSVRMIQLNSVRTYGIAAGAAKVRVAAEIPSKASQDSAAQVRILTLRYAKSSEVEALLVKIYGSNSMTVAHDQRTNILIIRAPKEVLEEAQGIIDHLDQYTEDQKRLSVYHLAHAHALETAILLNKTLGTGGAYNLTASADESSNSVIVNGDVDAQMRVTILLRDIDIEGPHHSQVSSSQSETRVFALKHVQADDMMTTLAARFSSDELTAIGPNPKTNSLVVVAPVSSFAAIAAVIAAKDSSPPAAAPR